MHSSIGFARTAICSESSLLCRWQRREGRVYMRWWHCNDNTMTHIHWPGASMCSVYTYITATYNVSANNIMWPIRGSSKDVRDDCKEKVCIMSSSGGSSCRGHTSFYSHSFFPSVLTGDLHWIFVVWKYSKSRRHTRGWWNESVIDRPVSMK